MSSIGKRKTLVKKSAKKSNQTDVLGQNIVIDDVYVDEIEHVHGSNEKFLIIEVDVKSMIEGKSLAKGP